MLETGKRGNFCLHCIHKFAITAMLAIKNASIPFHPDGMDILRQQKSVSHSINRLTALLQQPVGFGGPNYSIQWIPSVPRVCFQIRPVESYEKNKWSRVSNFDPQKSQYSEASGMFQRSSRSFVANQLSQTSQLKAEALGMLPKNQICFVQGCFPQLVRSFSQALSTENLPDWSSAQINPSWSTMANFVAIKRIAGACRSLLPGHLNRPCLRTELTVALGGIVAKHSSPRVQYVCKGPMGSQLSNQKEILVPWPTLRITKCLTISHICKISL